jgi:hypothetical protein
LKDITIISLADDVYYQYLKSLVISATINFPQALLFIVLVNMDKKFRDELLSYNSKMKVEIEQVNIPPGYDRACYCASRRAFLFKKLREETSNILLWVDADSIIRKPCNDLISHLNSCDVTMRPKVSGRFASGIIGINSSDVCNNFINRYYDLVKDDKDWMSDQKNLNRTYLEFKDTINFVPLANIYCDVWLSRQGVIWTAKSKTKKSNKYREEMTKYQKI